MLSPVAELQGACCQSFEASSPAVRAGPSMGEAFAPQELLTPAEQCALLTRVRRRNLEA